MKNAPVRAYIDHALACDPIYYSTSSKASKVKELLVADKTNLFSSEALSGPAWVGVAQRGIDHRTPVLQNLSHDFGDASILLILRRQDGYARSMYRQYVKAGGTHSMARFFGIGPNAASPLFSPDRFRYTPFVRALKARFTGNVNVLFFEQLLSDSAYFLDELSRMLDCPGPLEEPGKRNSSKLGSRGLSISRGLNRIFRGPLNPAAPIPGIPLRRKGRWRLENPVALLQDHWPGNSPKQSPIELSICQSLLEDCKEDNQALAAEVDRDLSVFGYY